MTSKKPGLMKAKIFLLVIALGLILNSFGQKPAIELTFTAIDSASYVQLDSIKVINRTHGVDTVLHYPDTVLTLYYVGINDNQDIEGNFRVMQNYPNPLLDQTMISIYVPERDKINLMVTDILGQQINRTEMILDKGYHSFRFIPGSQELYFVAASWRGMNQCIKILSVGNSSDKNCQLEYLGRDDNAVIPLKSSVTRRDFSFIPGDELLYIGYSDTLASGRLDKPEASQTYTFQFATNIPCLGTPTVDYEGQVYNTIQIFSQCWLKENLNVGTMLPGEQDMSDNGVIEKYCYNDEEDSCSIYGGLYQWNEMMQYTIQQGTQGICPIGWHIPTDEEWKILEGAIDSQYELGDPFWDWDGYRGFDAGLNLKSTRGCYSGNNGTDIYGFSSLPGGARGFYDAFLGVGNYVLFWSSNESYASYIVWYRSLDCDLVSVYRHFQDKTCGYSVRCLRDY
jgi:uncharacterized protein (TIGR02145 family)